MLSYRHEISKFMPGGLLMIDLMAVWPAVSLAGFFFLVDLAHSFSRLNDRLFLWLADQQFIWLTDYLFL